MTGKPDTDHRILLDASRSVIPEGVSVDYENNIVEVPMTGVDGMKLAFLADTRIDIASAEGVVDGVMLTDMAVTEEAEGIVLFLQCICSGARQRTVGVFVHGAPEECTYGRFL